MPIFQYRVISHAGDISTGRIEADSIDLARKRLRQRRLQVVSIKRDWVRLHLGGRVKSKDLVVFTRQMAAMMEAGIPLTRALNILYEQAETAKLRSIIQQVLISVESGESLSSALAQHPRTFRELYVRLVMAGEMSGQISLTLDRIADFLERSEDISKKIRGAAIYPVMVTLLTMVALGVVYVVVIPSFADLFNEMPDIPRLTRMNLYLSDLVRTQPHIVLGALVAIGAGVRYAFVNPVTRALFDRWGLHLPMIGTVIQKAAIARFTSTLSTLLASGVQLMDALTLCSDTAGNVVIKAALERARREVSEGAELADPLRRSGVIPPMVTSMIAVGQEAGNLEEMLQRVATFYEKDVKSAIDAALEMIKPISMVFLAVMIGAVLLSVYGPLYDSMMMVAE